MIALIQGLIPWELLSGIVVAVIGFAAIWFGGRRSAKADAKIEELEEYANTRRKLDEVGRLSDADASRDWLRERGKRKGNL